MSFHRRRYALIVALGLAVVLAGLGYFGRHAPQARATDYSYTPTPTPATLPLPDLTVRKDPKPWQPNPRPGGSFAYIITVTNIGTAATPPPPVEVMLRDLLPKGATLRDWTILQGSGICALNWVGQWAVDCRRGRMAPNEVWRVEIRVWVPWLACVPMVNRAKVDPYNWIKESDETNNSASLKTYVGVDRCIDTDGTATDGDGFENPVTPGSVQVFFGAKLTSWPTGWSTEGLDMFDNDANARWTFGLHGDDLHVEGPAYPGAIRDGFHDHPNDPHVLDYDGSLNVSGQHVSCDFETGTFCPVGLPGNVKFYDRNLNGNWDDGEDIVLDVNGDGVFD